MQTPARVVAALLVLLTSGCASTVARPVFPGTQWEKVASPESVGWSSGELEKVRARLATMPSTGMVVVVGGRVLFEYGDVETLSYLASVRKSVLSMMIGNYVASGRIRLDRTLAEIGIDDIGGLSDTEKEATVLDLMTARSGIYHEAANSGDDTASAPPRGSQRHGTYMLYNNWDFNALGTVFERETGRNIYDALETDIARPIGMQDFVRSEQKKTGNATKSEHLAYHMVLSTRDMARIGLLMLREGEWAGKQVVPRAWVRRISSVFTPVTEMNPPARRSGPFGYGYLWWVWDGPSATGPYRGAYTGLGAVGQHITVVPALDMVVAHKTKPGQDRRVTHEEYLQVLDMIIAAKKK